MGNLTQADVSLRASSRLTARSQTTIPAAVRDAMNLQPGENIEYAVLPGGKVLISRQETVSDDDPVMASFLSFLADDMRQHPEKIKTLDAALVTRIASLTAGMDVNLDAPLTDDE
ncbi:type II toxin-antitoxin system PrlF family antitoxin [Pantoea brenneri]|nr:MULTISPECIES: type II toxin-antitoxin system PrlF family antitoxin [Pantoea]KKD31362.1 regulator [Pantoea sp. 3.5.1]MBS6034556.1 type II toxin-antitoxin system PrlF family antitoxin [Pantoea sp.]MBZ6396021.1 type II toxin-antitoxin system PrlF family antitoxin [Pantoea sp.]MBZ6439490.1 type II toxin-antitoxin system PrlF family antitoxin [Pantoea sp.]MCQ5472038.1 type II toxin-antitoxin system PrlF family antitoxin [Pantoea brenneri]